MFECRKMSNFKLPKWAVMVLAALVFIPLVADWAAPGAGTRIAYEALREAEGGGGRRMLFPLWSWLVGLVGKDVVALGWLSACAGMVCVWFVAAIAGAIFGAAVRRAESQGVKGEFPFVESAAVLLAGLAFALTPGFIAAATRISPLMIALMPPLAAAALLVGVVTGGAPGVRALPSGASETVRFVERLKAGRWRLLLAVGLVGYSAFELAVARRVIGAMAFPAVWVWLAVGVMPALVIAWCVRMRWIGAMATDEASRPKDTRKTLWWSFAAWGAAVLVLGAVAAFSGKLNEGRVASRIVAAIIANAEESGKIAVVSDGGLGELFFFMLPENIKLISLAREREPEYGRELGEWVRQELENLGGGGQRNLSTCSAGQPAQEGKTPLSTSTSSLHLTEDLAFAAELGPRALVDEWAKIDKAGFEAKVATVASYFPTRAKWDEARAMLGVGSDRRLRRLMAVCGNALGCALIERGDLTDAWAIFKAIVDSVEPTNYAAYLNLLGMVQRGFAASKDVVADLTKRRQQIEKNLKSWERILGAARAGGRLYADPDDVARYEKAKREAVAKRELPPEARAFGETVAAAPKDAKRGRAAQEAIHKAIREGKVRADVIGGRLIAIDLALGDRENAEKDAIDVLKLDRHDPAANAAVGSLAGERGDYERAERYLRRAIATGKTSVAAKNDLAYVLMRRGKLDEAEAFAREAVKGYGEAWASRETLAAILIRKGQIEEGERELAKAEELAAKAGVPKGKIVSIAIDRARLFKAKDDMHHFKVAMRQLKSRRDLTDEQREEVKGLDW